ncbi:MAG: hypothetical protein ABIB11_04800, partial [Candidatus Omnitrophota bacterium]
MKEGFLGGDYIAQFYPWTKLYSESLKNFSLPFWSRYIHSGFPLMAEGQIGGFYPVNIIMYFFLPFKVAYNYSVILHFLIAGFFTYLYSRKLGADQWGGSLAALLFCFGSAYAGCFYNVVTLRTLCWFPVVLLLFEKALDCHASLCSARNDELSLRGLQSNPKQSKVLDCHASLCSARNDELSLFRSPRPLVITAGLSGIIAGMQFLAGFLQMAAYAWAFYIIYLFFAVKIRGMELKNFFLPLIVFIPTSIITALPQLLLSYELANLSGRGSATLGFALWNSFIPPAFFTVFFPYWLRFLGHQLYIGVFSILFLICALKSWRAKLEIRPLVIVGGIALLCALGRYNPLYVGLLKLINFYSFRNPSKFLFFTLFSMSVLSGIGFTYFFKSAVILAPDSSIRGQAPARIHPSETGLDLPVKPEDDEINKSLKIFSVIAGFMLLVFAVSKFLLGPLEGFVKGWLKVYVSKFVLGKPYHRYNLEYYTQKIDGLYRALSEGIALNNIFVIVSLLLVFIAIFLSIYLMKKQIKRGVLLKGLIVAFIFIDILVYSAYGTGFRGNIEPYSYAEAGYSKILDYIKNDNEYFRVLPFGLKDKEMPWWLMPNSNILAGIESVAAYSPLVEGSYKDKLLSLEVVDDSLGLLSPDNKAIEESYGLLRLLNVKYIISARELNYSFLERIISEKGLYLYYFRDFLPRAFFVENLKRPYKSQSVNFLRISEYRDGFIQI